VRVEVGRYSPSRGSCRDEALKVGRIEGPGGEKPNFRHSLLMYVGQVSREPRFLGKNLYVLVFGSWESGGRL
jgi:hypothetical protein